jgi:hypothetical protein
MSEADLKSDTEDGDELEIVAKVYEKMGDDECDCWKQSHILVDLHNNADDAGKTLIDDTLRCLSGYGLATLLRMAREPEYNGDIFGDDADVAQKSTLVRDKADIKNMIAALQREADIAASRGQ